MLLFVQSQLDRVAIGELFSEVSGLLLLLLFSWWYAGSLRMPVADAASHSAAPMFRSITVVEGSSRRNNRGLGREKSACTVWVVDPRHRFLQYIHMTRSQNPRVT